MLVELQLQLPSVYFTQFRKGHWSLPSYRRTVANLSLFSRYFRGFCSLKELSSIMPLLYNLVEKLAEVWHHLRTVSSFAHEERPDLIVPLYREGLDCGIVTIGFPRNADSANFQVKN